MTSTATIRKSLTPYNADNDRAVEMMLGKAMCAYANWQNTKDNEKHLAREYGSAEVAKAVTAHESEYEATVHCIDMLVSESVPEICIVVIDSARRELGI